MRPSARSFRTTALRTLLIAATVGGAIVVAPAQAHAQRPQGGGRAAAALQTQLFEGITLTAAQQTRVDSIQGAFREQNQAERAAGGGGRPDETAMEARRTRMQAQRTALRAVLTADQQPTFDKNVAELAKRMAERRGGRPR